VWNVEERSQVSELHGHKFGLNCVVSYGPYEGHNDQLSYSLGKQHFEKNLNVNR